MEEQADRFTVGVVSVDVKTELALLSYYSDYTNGFS